MNFWPGIESGTDPVVGTFTYPGAPLVSSIQSLRYGPAASVDVLDDFEASDALNAWSVKNVDPTLFRLSTGPTSYGHSGQVLGMRYDNPANGGEALRSFSSPQDWRNARSLNFYVENLWDAQDFQLELRDNGGSADTAERFVYEFSNTFNGWKWMSIPLSAFKRRTDWQPRGAPDDGLTLSSVWGFSLKPLEIKASGSRATSSHFDDFQLEREPVPPSGPCRE